MPIMAHDIALACRAVVKRFADVVAVDGLDLEVHRGECFGLLGPNGAGKSTLLHMMSGFLKPSAGEVRVLGENAWGNPEMYRQVGLVPEREAVYPFLSGREFVLLAARLHKLPDAEAATGTRARTAIKALRNMDHPFIRARLAKEQEMQSKSLRITPIFGPHCQQASLAQFPYKASRCHGTGGIFNAAVH